jgi:hypothetical protein
MVDEARNLLGDIQSQIWPGQVSKRQMARSPTNAIANQMTLFQIALMLALILDISRPQFSKNRSKLIERFLGNVEFQSGSRSAPEPSYPLIESSIHL